MQIRLRAIVGRVQGVLMLPLFGLCESLNAVAFCSHAVRTPLQWLS